MLTPGAEKMDISDLTDIELLLLGVPWYVIASDALTYDQWQGKVVLSTDPTALDEMDKDLLCGELERGPHQTFRQCTWRGRVYFYTYDQKRVDPEFKRIVKARDVRFSK